MNKFACAFNTVCLKHKVMRLLLFLTFMTLQFFSVAKAGCFTSHETGIHLFQNHCCIDLENHHDVPAMHSQHEELEDEHHKDLSSHQHSHRHSPEEPEHSHSHQHSSAHAHGVHFVSVSSFQLTPYVERDLNFGEYSECTIQGPFLDSVFRPPIV